MERLEAGVERAEILESVVAEAVWTLLVAQAQHGNLTVYSFDAKDFRRLGVTSEVPG